MNKSISFLPNFKVTNHKTDETTNPMTLIGRGIPSKLFLGLITLDIHYPVYKKFKNGNEYIMGRNTCYKLLKEYGYEYNGEIWYKVKK